MSMDANTSSTEMSHFNTVSLEQERDSYKEKVEHMKMLVRQYSEELQSHKIRKEGMETVSKLLQEARQEIAVLQKKVKTRDTAIRNLQSRLTSNGLSSNVAMEEGDVYMPGASDQLLENLTRENSRLRTLLRGASVNPEELNSLQQVLKKKEETIESQNRTCEVLRSRVGELEKLMNLSENEKDITISTLQSTVHKMREESQTRDVLCHSLAEETSNLRQQLHEVAVTCQQMALRLERSEKASRTFDKAQTTGKSEFNNDYKEKLLQEKRELQKKVDEVVTMNKRWQEYETQRETFVKQLQNTNRVLHERLAAAQASQLSFERTKKINEALDEAQRRLMLAEEEKRRLEHELQERNQILQQQTTEAEHMKHELDLVHQGGNTIHRSDAEIVDALKAQIQICTEDFESERRDREKAQSRVSSLEGELQKVKLERDRLLQAAVPRVPSESHYNQGQFYENREFYNNFNVPSPYPNIPHYQNELATRGPHGAGSIMEHNVVDGTIQVDAPPPENKGDKQELVEESFKSVTDPLSDNVSEGPLLDDAPLLSSETCELEDETSGINESVNESENGNQTRKKDVLTCPKCGKEFTSDKHGELLDHIELCCD